MYYLSKNRSNVSMNFFAVFRGWLIALSIISAAFAAPVWAHKDKDHSAQAQGSSSKAGMAATPAAGPEGAHGMMDGMPMEMDNRDLSFFERLFGWFGRLHPLIVHFPIAFFPAALFTAVVGRRRPAFAAPVQFLVVAGGIFAPVAAATGGLAGISADAEPILAFHRWLGIAVSITGAGLGIWAWRRPWEDRGAGMIIALILMTIAIAVQGFLGAGLTHGMDHMMF